MMDESRPEKDILGSMAMVSSVSSCEDFGLPVEILAGLGGGSIKPARDTLFVRVLGVSNLEILKVLAFGVAAKVELDLAGEPASVTLIGDCGRLAGEARRDALNGELALVTFGAVDTESLKGDCCIMDPPRFALCGEVFSVSLNGDCWGRRAGDASTELLRS